MQAFGHHLQLVSQVLIRNIRDFFGFHLHENRSNALFLYRLKIYFMCYLNCNLIRKWYKVIIFFKSN